MKATFCSQMRSFYTCSYTSSQYFNHLAQILKNGVGGLKSDRDLPAGRIYQLPDGDSYAGWLVEW